MEDESTEPNWVYEFDAHQWENMANTIDAASVLKAIRFN